MIEGKVNGTLQGELGPGREARDATSSLAHVRAEQLVGAFTKDITVTGKLDGNFAVVGRVPDVAGRCSPRRARRASSAWPRARSATSTWWR